jgi:hypothetical protein
MKRHMRSFLKGFTGGRTFGGGELVPTPAEVMAKATKMLQRVMLLQLVWFLCFLAGGALTVWTAWKNVHVPASCNGQGGPAVGKAPAVVAAVTAACEHHSYLWPVLLILVGIAGLFVTGYVATRLAVRYLGTGAAAFLRGGRRFMGPMGPRTGGQDTGGGFSSPATGVPPGFKGLPPGTSGSPPGSPLS